MVAAGLLVQGLFSLVGGVPDSRPATIVTTHFQWNYTTFLNIAFVVVFAVIYWLYRTRPHDDTSARYAIDPVCSMQVEIANAPAHLVHDGVDIWFCCDRCRDRYAADHVALSPKLP
jgi:YHS domain-containing protein